MMPGPSDRSGIDRDAVSRAIIERCRTALIDALRDFQKAHPGMKQRQIAEALNIKQSKLSPIFNKNKTPRIDTLVFIARALDRPLASVVGVDEPIKFSVERILSRGDDVAYTVYLSLKQRFAPAMNVELEIAAIEVAPAVPPKQLPASTVPPPRKSKAGGVGRRRRPPDKKDKT